MKSALGLALTLALAACQTKAPPLDYAEFRSSKDPVTAASHLAENIRACWFASSRPAFAEFSYAPELNSYSGRPRVLIVPESDPGGLPKLVVEASAAERGTSIKLFGPLMAGAEAPTIRADVARWSGGGTGCSPVAVREAA